MGRKVVRGLERELSLVALSYSVRFLSSYTFCRSSCEYR